MDRVSELIDKAIAQVDADRLDEAELILNDLASFFGNPVSGAEVYRMLGAVYLMKGANDPAIEALRKSIELNPQDGTAYLNLCEGLRREGRIAEAIEEGERAVKFEPNNPMCHNNLGYALEQDGDLDRAIACIRKALSIKPDYEASFNNLALALWRSGRIDEALSVYEDAISLNPENPVTHSNYAGCLFLSGNFELGWKEYDLRFQTDFIAFPDLSFGRWDGQSRDFDELILVGEQGCGDVILFLRYGRLLADRVDKLSIAVSENMVELVRSTGIYDTVYTKEEIAEGEFIRSRWFPLISVPGLYAVSRANPILTDAYIPTDSEADRRWGDRFREEGGFVMGLNWQGNPEAEQGSLRGRSFPLECLKPLSALEGVRFVSLQKGTGSGQLANCSFKNRFVRCQELVDETWDFVETASMAKACDLVVTSDTSLAHLAGSVGARTWMLLQKVPDWRWGLTRDRAPWYPSIKIIRQERRDDWNGVVRRVQNELAELLSGENRTG